MSCGEATTPARCAAPPAPAMNAMIPRANASLLSIPQSATGVRCALNTFFSYSTPKESRISNAPLHHFQVACRSHHYSYFHLVYNDMFGYSKNMSARSLRALAQHCCYLFIFTFPRTAAAAFPCRHTLRQPGRLKSDAATAESEKTGM